jgi:6-pyruvoyltetrahydropterin/6-carboxytetrahydropterin synthase
VLREKFNPRNINHMPVVKFFARLYLNQICLFMDGHELRIRRSALFELKIRTHFAAAHQLKMVAQKCENLHGHNWRVEVCVAGGKLDEAGILIDFGILKSHIKEIIQTLDHKFLNEMDHFKGNPSSERIAVYIAQRLQEKLDDNLVRVSRVTCWESDDASATYTPDGLDREGERR